jgi:hypothetical protein
LFNYERDIIHLTGLAKDTFLSGASKETLDKMTVLGLGRSELDATLRILPLFSVSQFFHESLPKMSHLKNTVLEDGDARWAGFANLEGNLRGSAPFIFDGIEDKAPTPAVTKTIERVRETAGIPYIITHFANCYSCFKSLGSSGSFKTEVETRVALLYASLGIADSKTF